ncbi:sirohydrochlorin chelatase [Corynebacterium comes]|uniref:Sirohydrochlorin cobaltochelatase n=1 Tax=Corynebacterium comes TaxID=2675218 RepID=A0A6B8VWF2_9CORY|nr:sirohydrochlorin chelatase [Corynebacterium comes]QGU05664.1 Sirohydrochlorin cobaltochelatase [Corynebacterium comes]
MTALITLSHGSRHPQAEPGIRRLTALAGEIAGVDALAAHLEFDEPSLVDAAVLAAERGHDDAIVVPLLFTRAFHARHDVPAALAQARAATGLNLRLAEGLGTGPEIASVLVERLTADAPEGAHVVLYPAGTSDPGGMAALAGLADLVASLSGRGVTVVPATGPVNPGVGLVEVATGHESVHILPLFVTDGLLLDRITTLITRIQDATGARITHSTPLVTDLAALVASRHTERTSP